MSKQRRTALILVLIGIGCPLFFLLFVSDHDPDASLAWNLHHMEIVLRDPHWVHPTDFDETLEQIRLIITQEKPYHRFGGMMFKPKVAVRYKYVVLFGIFCIVIGTGFIPLSRGS